jgi:hypothetical protein
MRVTVPAPQPRAEGDRAGAEGDASGSEAVDAPGVPDDAGRFVGWSCVGEVLAVTGTTGGRAVSEELRLGPDCATGPVALAQAAAA